MPPGPVPVVTILNSTAGVYLDRFRPTIQWTHGTTLDSVRQYVQIYKPGSILVYDNSFEIGSTELASGVSTHTPAIRLENTLTYDVYVGTGGRGSTSEDSGWSTVNSFTISITIPTPTGLTPVDNGTVTSSRPAVAATVGPITLSTPDQQYLLWREFQWATDSGFTANLRTYQDTSGGVVRSGGLAYPAALARMPQGAKFLRVRAVDSESHASSWSATNDVTIAHVPSTSNRTPSLNGSIQYATSLTIRWQFNDLDTTDSQTKFEAELWKQTDPEGTLIESGEITGSPGLLKQHIFTGLDTTWRDTELRWRVRVADLDGVYSPWSVDNVFFMSELPVVTVISPTEDEVLTTAMPLIDWTFSSTLGRTQAQWTVTIRNATTDVAVITSGAQAGAATEWQVPNPALAVGVDYEVVVTVVDSTGLTNTAIQPFTTDYEDVDIPIFTLNTDSYTTEGLVIVDWSMSTQDPDFIYWRVYRRPVGQPDFDLIAELGEGVEVYYDYTSPSGVPVEYAVVQVIFNFGNVVESAYVPQSFGLTTGYYVLITPDDTSLNLTLWHVTGDTFQDEQEMAVLNVIGRGRRAEYGTRYGQTGTLSGSFRDREGQTARAQRLALEALRDSGLEIYLRNPFGDVWKVALMSATMTRVSGVGLHEMSTYTIEYSEIAA